MPQSRELRGVVVPDVDDRAVQRNVEGPLNRVMDRVGSITPDLDLSGLSSGLGLGGSSGRSVGGAVGGNSIQVAQLDALEDINDTLRRRDGGGGGGGLLTGLGLGRALGGGVSIGSLTVAAGSIGLGAAIQKKFGELSIRELFDIQTSGPGSILNALTGGLSGAGLGIGNILLEQIPDVGEALGLIDDAEAFENRLLSGARNFGSLFNESVRKGSLFWTRDVPNAIRNIDFPEFTLPDFSSIQLPTPVKRLVDVLDGPDLSQNAPPTAPSVANRDGLQGGGDQRLLNTATRQERQSPARVTVDQTLDVSRIEVDPQDILGGLEQQLNGELQELRDKIDAVESALTGGGF